MKHPVLDQHNVIGWDIDQTLINGPNSVFFCAYILAHPEKVHHLITFRPPGWDEEIYELFADAFPRERIASINCCSINSSIEEIDAFKGQQARALGCTIMVDDMEFAVAAGCAANGVVFLNSLYPIR